MDPVTHGITGALLGKGYFHERYGRVATFSVVLGAVFPDIDVVWEVASRDPLGIVKYHRAITHSFVALPFFAMLLAWLTRWVCRRRGIEAPSWGILSLCYGIGIASHIVLDGMTSFGTRMWYPISHERVAWDVLFIIDFAFTSIMLVPQMIAWIYSVPEKSRRRSVWVWICFSIAAVFFWLAAQGAGYPFRFSVDIAVVAVFAVLFFGPAVRAWGRRISRAAWCQAGTCIMVLYLIACGVAHHIAFERTKMFAERNHISAERIGALPVPPSWLDWGGAIRAPNGLYESEFDLRQVRQPLFRFTPDSPPDPYISRAFQLPDVQLYWQFARFPSILSFPEGEDHVVELGENRFTNTRPRGPQPFTYRIVFDAAGTLISKGWLTRGVLRQHMQRVPHPGNPETQGESQLRTP
jgi:membrane-bound metal-dependent hydrolase YbcI (DUF457 family)